MSDELMKQIQLLEKLLKKDDNKTCADCRRKSPSWASISHGLFICIKCAANKIANEFWEAKLKDNDFQRLQNDDTKLNDFIKDKYERRRYCAQGKDPMTLIYEGKDPKENNEKKEENYPDEEVENAGPKIKINNHQQITLSTTKNNLPGLNKINEENKSNILLSVSNNNASLNDFNSTPHSSTKSESNLVIINESIDIKVQSKTSGFAFINKTNTFNEVKSESLIDLNSYESQKTNQIKQLTESITNVYTKPVESPNIGSQSNGFIQMNTPNINILNNYYNYGMNNYTYNQQYSNPNLMNSFSNNINQGSMAVSYAPNIGNYSSRGMNMSSIGMNMNIGINYLDRNVGANTGSLSSRGTNISNPVNSNLGSDQQFNYDYYNSMKVNTPKNFNSSSLLDLEPLQTNSNKAISYNNTNKKNDDPFKNLVSFK